MKKACLVVNPPFTHGEIFNRQNARLNRDNCLLFFHLLQDEFAARGVDLNTQDINPPENCEYVIYNEMPSQLPSESDAKRSFVLLFESELIRPDNWKLESHRRFKKLFTWDDRLIDGSKYIKFNFTHYGQVPFLKFSEKSKFCTLIAGNKDVRHPFELYSKRKEAIRWFERNHPNEFEFYGVGWDVFTFTGPKLVRALNKIPYLRKMLAEKWPSYRGMVNSKLEVLRQYKFSICYENAEKIPGYITEKIFDSMSAGCIPIYWGPPNILKYVPKECFIDRTQFNSYEELYRYLKAMTADEYDQRLKAIESYLKSSQHDLFAPGPLAKIVCEQILSERNEAQ